MAFGRDRYCPEGLEGFVPSSNRASNANLPLRPDADRRGRGMGGRAACSRSFCACSAETTTILVFIGPASAIAGLIGPGLLPEDGFANRCFTDLMGLICRLAGSLVIGTLSSTVRFGSEIFVCSECDRCSATALVASELGSTRFLTGLRCATGWLDGDFFWSARRLIEEAGRDHLTMTPLLRRRTVFWGGSVLPSNRSSRA